MAKLSQNGTKAFAGINNSFSSKKQNGQQFFGATAANNQKNKNTDNNKSRCFCWKKYEGLIQSAPAQV